MGEGEKRAVAKDMRKATNLIFHLFDTRRTVFICRLRVLKRLIGFDVYAKYEKL
jgi:hypothetical protein